MKFRNCNGCHAGWWRDNTCMEGTVIGVARSAPEGVQVPGGRIEIPCEYGTCSIIRPPFLHRSSAKKKGGGGGV